MVRHRLVGAIVLLTQLLCATILHAEPPHASYIFPAGGQRGTTVKVRIGGHFLHERCGFEMLGDGVTAPAQIERTDTIWFEGPLIRQPASQQAEDYPQDYAADLQVAADASAGRRWWRCWNAQGVTQPLGFIVGDLPEIVEEETDGEAIPVSVTLPVTVNGRIFPREDIDVWTFTAQAGQSLTCAAVARDLGSPLVARLQVRDGAGKVLGESTGSGQSEAQVRFIAPASGEYHVSIQDVAAGGLQHYVYRLTITAGPWIDHVYPLGGRRGSAIRLEVVGTLRVPSNSSGASPADYGTRSVPTTLEWTVPDFEPGVIERTIPIGGQASNPVRFDVSDLPEFLEAEPNEASDRAIAASVPAMLNGRIQSPGDVDHWSLALTKGKPVVLEAQVARLASPLAIVMTLRGSGGKQLAQADGSTATGDVSLTFNPPADGTYTLEVAERFARRGGPQFGYRVRLAEPVADFQVLAPDSIAVDVGSEKKVDVLIERQGEFKSPIALRAEGLPAGVTCDEVQVPSNANKASLTFKVAAGTPVVSALLKVVGKAEINGQSLQRTAVCAGQKDGFSRGEPIAPRLAVTLPTPFKFAGQFSFIYAPRGGMLKKKYAIDRGGYEGPFTAQLADRQGRHLQGVTGPVVTVPAGATEFEYPLLLPPWMELGRTSRTNIMLTGELKDSSGAVHKVCYTTKEQNEQLIALVSPAPLRLALDRGSYAVEAGAELTIPVSIKRDASVASTVKLELVVPRHMRDIAAEPVEAAASANETALTIRFGSAPGPLNMPLVIRATGERGGEPIVAEIGVELVIPKSP